MSLPYWGVWWWAMGYTRIWRDSLKRYIFETFFLQSSQILDPIVIEGTNMYSPIEERFCVGLRKISPLSMGVYIETIPIYIQGGGGDQKHKIWDGAEKNSFAHLPFLMLFCRGITLAARLFKRGLCGQITSAWPTWNLLTHKIYSRVKVVAKPPLAMPMFRCCFVLLPLLYFRKFWLFTFLSSPAAAWMFFERFPR